MVMKDDIVVSVVNCYEGGYCGSVEYFYEGR